MSTSAGRSGRAAPLPPAERRQAIIAAVLPLLVERGSSATSKELALAAGVAEGTIWKAFTDKDDLLAAALDRATDPRATEEALRAIDPSLPFDQRLVKAADIIQRRMVDIWSLFTQIGTAGVPDDRRQLPDSDATIELFAADPAAIRLAPRDAARQFRALILAFSHPVLMSPPPSPAELVELFLHGVVTR